MANRIEVGIPADRPDPAGAALRQTLQEDLELQLEEIRIVDVYTIDAALTATELEHLRSALFTDPIIQSSTIDAPFPAPCDFVIQVGFRPGVTDNVGRSSRQGIEDVLGRPLEAGASVFKSTKYLLRGLERAVAERIAADALANALIEQYEVKSSGELAALGAAAMLELPLVTERSETEVKEIGLECSEAALQAISRSRTLALEPPEMRAIREYYADPELRARREAAGLPPNPTDIELEVLAQTWSEHCKHKIFAAEVIYTDAAGTSHVIDGLFKTYVRATTEKVAKDIDWLVSVFHDNAGIIRFDEENYFALKVETHNSPSALDPYGGAMTGIVGVNRDILGAGMGCRCILNTDVFCFASPYHDEKIPERLLHPRRVLRGVHRGVKDGGNESGIPTVNGAIVFHERFLGKPLVFCGTGGLLPAMVCGKASEEKAALPGDIIVMCGGRIGKDGIHGATFSSEELHEGSPATAVQIGDPITQKKMADMLIEARDLGLFHSITDNGAGGLSSSIGEMARGPGGAKVYLDKAPLKYPGLAPWEIFLSEAQERMTLAVPREHLETFLTLSQRREVESTAIGEFTHSGALECYYEEKLICALDINFLHEGLPRMHLLAELSGTGADCGAGVPPAGTVTPELAKEGLSPTLGGFRASPVGDSPPLDDSRVTVPVDVRLLSASSSKAEPTKVGEATHEHYQHPNQGCQSPPSKMEPTKVGEATHEHYQHPNQSRQSPPSKGDLGGCSSDVRDVDLATALRAVLASLNVCSKENFVRMYDHEVQGHSVLKPFQGAEADGPGDAAVLRPVPASTRGLAIACGICPKYSDLDSYRMTACAIDEAVRNLICVGTRPGTIAGLDNFCWPDPVENERNPDGRHKMAQLVRCCEALYDTCVAYGIPLISGKDSMKNDYNIGGVRISIPPTLLFTAAGIVEDVNHAVSMDVKRAGDRVYLLGATQAEMGGSEYYAVHGLVGGEAPVVHTAAAKARYQRLADAMAEGLVASCHDCSDGGLAVALAESAFAGGLGMQLDLTKIPLRDNAALLFSESQSRFVVTVRPEHSAAFAQAFADDALFELGEVTETPLLSLQCHDDVRIETPLAELKEAWQRPLRW